MARKQLQNLTEPMYYVLLCLLQPLHGYGIMQKIQVLTNGRVKVGPGTLYNLIDRFEKVKIVEKLPSSDKKNVYSLTPKGMTILEEEMIRLRMLIEDGERLRGKQ